MPELRALAAEGFSATLDPGFPALTCPVQAGLLTGRTPAQHGVVGNGWYFRELGEVLFWRQHNALVEGEKVWDLARRQHPGYRVANVCWWYAMGAATDITVTPRPVYHADGRKSPDCYTTPPTLHDELGRRLGPFPLFSYWGPTASLTSSRWITAAARHIVEASDPDLTLVYVPHLDYDLQRFGPHSPRAVAAAAAVDTELGPLLRFARDRGTTVVALSEYGITPVRRVVHLNRALRAEGLLRVHTQAGMEYLDPYTSRAFAVADHQIAHVYVRLPADLSRTRELLAALPGVEAVLDAEGKAARAIDHPRAGELIAVADPDAWFSYYYWHDDDRAPDFARCVDIHRKPGYDPAELFFDPGDRLARPRALAALVRSRLGLRATAAVVPLDPGCVRGSHGRLPADLLDGPLLLCSDKAETRDHCAATEVPGLLLRLAGLRDEGTAPGAGPGPSPGARLSAGSSATLG
jgi:predicted AlkP superfamily pyrophosphatase or phosphodiesterase